MVMMNTVSSLISKIMGWILVMIVMIRAGISWISELLNIFMNFEYNGHHRHRNLFINGGCGAGLIITMVTMIPSHQY
jgi:hypothetical protein